VEVFLLLIAPALPSTPIKDTEKRVSAEPEKKHRGRLYKRKRHYDMEYKANQAHRGGKHGRGWPSDGDG